MVERRDPISPSSNAVCVSGAYATADMRRRGAVSRVAPSKRDPVRAAGSIATLRATPRLDHLAALVSGHELTFAQIAQT
jgi:hypothetical protein